MPTRATTPCFLLCYRVNHALLVFCPIVAFAREPAFRINFKHYFAVVVFADCFCWLCDVLSECRNRSLYGFCELACKHKAAELVIVCAFALRHKLACCRVVAFVGVCFFVKRFCDFKSVNQSDIFLFCKLSDCLNVGVV